MNFREALAQALRTLRTERLRSFLTMFGIVWGTASVVFLMSWGLGVQRMLEDGLSRAGKNMVQAWAGKIGEDFTPAGDRRELWFTRADVEAVRRRVRLAVAVVGESRFWGSIGHGPTTLSTDVRGVEPAGMEMHGTAIAAGRPILPGDLRGRRRVAVLGERLRRRLLGPSGGIGATVRIRGHSFVVVGILARVGTQLWRDNGEEIDEQVWIPLTTLFALDPRKGKDTDVVDSILMRVGRRQDYDALKVEARAALAERLRFSPSDEEAVNMASPIDLLRKLPIDQTTGRPLGAGDVENNARVVFLGAKTARRLFGTATAVGRTVHVDGLPFTVVGVSEAKKDQVVYIGPADDEVALIPITTAQRRFVRDDVLSQVVLEPRTRPGSWDATIDARALLGFHHGFRTDDHGAMGDFNLEEVRQIVAPLQLGLRLFLTTASLITLGVGAVGVMNIMFVVVTERTKEIGLRKAVGGSNGAIFAQFLAETLMVCVTAGTAGALLGALGVMVMARVVGEGSLVNSPPLLLPERVLMILASLVGLGIAAGLLPAARAARIDPAVSLRAT